MFNDLYTQNSYQNYSISYDDQIIRNCLDSINPESILAYIQELQDFGSRDAYHQNRRQVAEWIKNRFKSLGYTNSVLDSFPLFGSYQYNVVTTIKLVKPWYWYR